MKFISIIFFACLLLSPNSAIYAHDEKASSPGPAHKRLAAFSGKWTFTSKLWESPGDKPMESKGTSTMRMILNGRYLQQDLKENAMGMKFAGLGLLGHDNVKEEYTFYWIDSLGTAAANGVGKFDEKKEAILESGSRSCSGCSGKSKAYRAEWKIEGQNKIIYSMFDPGPGDGAKVMEITYVRVK